MEISSGVEDSVTHISEARLDDFVALPAKHHCSEATMLSPEGPNDGAIISKLRGKKRGAGAIVTDAKRKKIAPNTITRRWQVLWACRVT